MCRKRKDISWTLQERAFIYKEQEFQRTFNFNIPFTKSLLYRLRKSLCGTFLEELNTSQYQTRELNDDKIQILEWQLKKYNYHDRNIIKERNKFLKEPLKVLQKAINDGDKVSLEYLQESFHSLSLNCCFMMCLDENLPKFTFLQVLILSGNYLTDIDGSLLPKRLIFLELFDNFISNLKNLVRKTPSSLQHLGLGRNKLNDDSLLHLLSHSRNCKGLRSLDFSNNDIYQLDVALEKLRGLESLRALNLEGNPCSVVPHYKAMVLQTFPELVYLDQTKILDEDRTDEVQSKDAISQIIFKVHRIIGLPEPPKDKHNLQTIHLEVEFPLLIQQPPVEESPVEEPPVVELVEEDPVDESNETPAKGKKGKPEKASKSQKEGKGKKKSPYTAPDEYDPKKEENNVWFKTERLPWGKIMEYPELLINSPDDDISLIRDSFRCVVNIRIVYLKIQPFSAKKQRGGGKGDKKSKQTTNSATDELKSPAGDEPETVLKKITLAKFCCELMNPNWSDATLDFYWADHDDVGAKAVKVDGSLKAINYDLVNDPKASKRSTQTGTEEIPKIPLPKIFTCQIGFGLVRQQPSSQ